MRKGQQNGLDGSKYGSNSGLIRVNIPSIEDVRKARGVVRSRFRSPFDEEDIVRALGLAEDQEGEWRL